MAGDAPLPSPPSSKENEVIPDRETARTEGISDQIILSADDFLSDDLIGNRPTRSDLSETSPEKKIGQYTLLRQLGKGGMGVVWLARQESLKRDVAIKIIPAGRYGDDEEVLRFRREAKIAASLQHPNIVQVYDVGEEGNIAYLVMEYLESGTLHQYLASRPMDILESAMMLEQVARAIHYAHQKGIIHRDLKPGNILLVNQAHTTLRSVAIQTDSRDTKQTDVIPYQQDGISTVELPQLRIIPKITDFGLAKDIGRSSNSGPLTATGIALGTPSYMAPEQARGDSQEIAATTDVYALGAILYEMLCGRPPFSGKNAMETMEQVCFQRPSPPTKYRPSIPYALERICMKCLEKQSKRRYPSAEALANDLRRFIDQEASDRQIPIGLREWVKQTPPRGWFVLGGVALICFIACAMIWTAWAKMQKNPSGSFVESKESTYQKIEAKWVFQEGYRLCEQGNISRGIALLKSALELAQKTNQNHLEEAIRINLGEWEQKIPQLAFGKVDHARKGEPTSIRQLVFAPNGERLASAGADGELLLWDLTPCAKGDSPTCTRDYIKGIKGEITCISWSAESRYLAAGVNGNRVYIWDSNDGQLVGVAGPRLLPSAETVTGISFTSDEQQLLVIAASGTIYRVKVRSNDPNDCKPIGEHGKNLTSCRLAISKDGKTIVTTGNDLLKCWRFSADKLKELRHELLSSPIETLISDTSQNRFYLSTSRGEWYSLDLDSIRLQEWPIQAIPLRAMSVGNGGNNLATITGPTAEVPSRKETTIRIWDQSTRSEITTPIQINQLVTALALHPTLPLLAFGEDTGGISVYSFAPSRADGNPIHMTPIWVLDLWKVAFTSQGNRLLIVGDTRFQVFDCEKRQAITPQIKPDFPIVSGAIRPDGEEVAIAGAQGQLQTFDLKLFQKSNTLEPQHPEYRFSIIEYGKDGKSILACTDSMKDQVSGKMVGSKVIFWNPENGKSIRKLDQLKDAISINSIGLSSTNWNILGCQDHTARLWKDEEDTFSGFFSGTSPVTIVTCHPDGRRFAVGYQDGTIRIFDRETRQPIHEWFRFTNPISGLVFSPDGKYLFGTSNVQGQFWHTDSGLPIGSMIRTHSPIRSVAYDPKGRWVVTGSQDGSGQFWNATFPTQNQNQSEKKSSP